MYFVYFYWRNCLSSHVSFQPLRPPTTLMQQMLHDFRLIDLKKCCKQANLNCIGQKQELFERVKVHINSFKDTSRMNEFNMFKNKIFELHNALPKGFTTGSAPVAYSAEQRAAQQNRMAQQNGNVQNQNTNNINNINGVQPQKRDDKNVIQITGASNPSKNSSRTNMTPTNMRTNGVCCTQKESDILLKTDYIHNPFFTQRYFITKPKPLVSVDKKNHKKHSLSIKIPFEWYKKLVNKEEQYECILRIYDFKQAHVDFLPHDIKVNVNGWEIALPPMIPASHAGVKPRHQAKPLVLTQKLRKFHLPVELEYI